MLKESPESELILELILQATCFSDHLIAYHDSELLDQLKEQLTALVTSQPSELT